MKTQDYRGIIQIISEMTLSNLALISFLALPFVLDSWFSLLSTIFTPFETDHKIISLISIIVFYMLCIYWIHSDNKYRKNLEKKRLQIIAWMTAKGWTQRRSKGVKYHIDCLFD